MNDLVVKPENSVVISDSTKELIKHGVSKNTLAAYGRTLTKLDTWPSTIWINPRGLNDELLAEYLTHLHESGKSPATISQAAAAAKWRAKNANQHVVGAVTTGTLTGIRRDGRDRGRGQYRGREKYARNPLQYDGSRGQGRIALHQRTHP